MANDVTWLMATVHQEESLMPAQAVKGGPFPSTMNRPFGISYGDGAC